MDKLLLSRRAFALGAGALSAARPLALLADPARPEPLAELPYTDVTVEGPLQAAQLANTHGVLMSLDEDSLLKPFRQFAGQPAPGADLGGWYTYDPRYDWRSDDAGFAPGATFGQWISALARAYALSGDEPTRAKVVRLNAKYARAISGDFFAHNRFPAYCYDKLLLGLIDSQRWVADPQASKILAATTTAALPHLPPRAIEREVSWREGTDQSFRWDESYTNPENLFLAYRRGAGARYRALGERFLDDAPWFDLLARGENVMAGRHAYSYVNSLCSAMQAYLTLGSEKHLRAARNGFDMLSAQSFPTGGWGPDEKLTSPDAAELYSSLTGTHNSFETPCGAYAHFKLTRYLLRVTREARYGDSMERVMYNTVLGAKPMHADGRAFYYADYHFAGRKVYSNHRFPCCSGTLPQVATDYGINAYLRARDGLYVNLYLPSQVRWHQQGVRCTLRQSGDYPLGETVAARLETQRPTEFTLYLRIPAWADGARVAVNGAALEAQPGSFVALRRLWRTGDEIHLQLPCAPRLEAVNAQHPNTVALLCGPLVLFARLEDGRTLRPERAELLRVRRAGPQLWQTQVQGIAVSFVPYTAIEDEPYTTFLNLRT